MPFASECLRALRMHIFGLRLQADAVCAAGSHGFAQQAGAALEAVILLRGRLELVPAHREIIAVLAVASGLQPASPNQQVVDCLDRHGAGLHAKKHATLGPVVHQRVVDKIKLILWPRVTLGSKRDEVRVLGLRALLDDVAHHVGNAAIGKFQLVTGPSARPIGQPVVKNVALCRPALEQMPHFRMVKVAACHRQAGDCAHIQVVASAVTIAVAAKLTVFDDQFSVCLAAGKNAIFIVREGAIAHAQGALFKPYARPVAVWNASAHKVKPFHRHLSAPHHPDSFSLSRRARRNQPDPSADGSQRQPVLRPHCHVGAVIARIHLNYGSSPRQYCRFSYCFNSFRWTDPNHLGVGCVACILRVRGWPEHQKKQNPEVTQFDGHEVSRLRCNARQRATSRGASPCHCSTGAVAKISGRLWNRRRIRGG